MKAFRVTYDIVTSESAEQGDYAESGFVLPGGWHVDVTTPDATRMDLRSAVALVGLWYMVQRDRRTDRLSHRCRGTEKPPSTPYHHSSQLYAPEAVAEGVIGHTRG